MGEFSKYIQVSNLKAELARKSLTHKKMAVLIGKKGASSFSDIINGRVEPKITDMISIAAILGSPVDYFFNIELRVCSNLESEQHQLA